jgi:superoxide reductase
MKETKFFICEHCGNIIEYVKETGVPVMCCGQKMTELVPGTSDGAHEKHVPVVTIDGCKVTVEVGSVEHPMVDVHYIPWVALVTESAIYRKHLKPGQAPVAEFLLGDEKPVAVYAFCNLHGLWKKEL